LDEFRHGLDISGIAPLERASRLWGLHIEKGAATGPCRVHKHLVRSSERRRARRRGVMDDERDSNLSQTRK
jgi:hypothetical protein